MTIRTFSFTRANADPYVPPDWTDRGQIAGKVQSNFWVGNSGDGSQNSIITDNFVIPVKQYTAGVVIGASGSTSGGVALINSANNGYAFLSRNTDVRVFTVVNRVLGSLLATYTGAVPTGATVSVLVDESVGVGRFETFVNGVSRGFINNTTYTGLFAGCVCRGAAQIASTSLEFTPTHSFDTFNGGNNIEVGQVAVPYTTTGFSSVTSITSDKAGLTTSNILDVAGDGTVNIAGWTEAGLYPSLPSSVLFTATDGTNTAQITKTVVAPSGWSQVTLNNAVYDDNTYLGYWINNIGRSVANGVILYWPTTPDFNYDAESGITTNAERTIVTWAWDVVDGRMYEYTVTVNDAGDIIIVVPTSDITYRVGWFQAMIEIAEGSSERIKLPFMANSVATTEAQFRTDFNTLLTFMRSSGWFESE